MKSILYCILCIFIQVCHCLSAFDGWGYINLHCRDNENKPVDWWFLYKPPATEINGPGAGQNFSFLTHETVGKWEPSKSYINSGSMLQNTLSPFYRPTYADHLSVISYGTERKRVRKESSAEGVMMADEVGGIWMVHTVPGLSDLVGERPTFPEKELESGHIIMCLSLDLPVLNQLAAYVRDMAPKILQTRLPAFVKKMLPNWDFSQIKLGDEKRKPLRPINFYTTDLTVQVVVMARRPKESLCLYKEFAQLKGIVLDVYGHDKRALSICDDKGFGVRNIDKVSLKYHEDVNYIDRNKDKAKFAVSTAVHWQRTGKLDRQFWSCISSKESEDGTNAGGNIICLLDYNLWWSFDNLKVKEPQCPH